ncbi:hypothetical protein A3715_04885 [Oleiphilus sp. HI0009]|nr:ATP-binding protein [Oleiphilus sp. HI0067]KZX83438.1 hypothetical protein A3715_04885 [Oleiphilus sp. HI0009]KZY68756.1 hypothetical protein A3738_04835 [Oleiphilus sp. HI0066]KZY71440.1 hypothetical protein A3739_05050 [Oleiphilus sp. HI0067]
MSFTTYALEQSSRQNKIGVVIGSATAFVYAPIDYFLFPDHFVAGIFGAILRGLIAAPLLILALYLLKKEDYESADKAIALAMILLVSWATLFYASQLDTPALIAFLLQIHVYMIACLTLSKKRLLLIAKCNIILGILAASYMLWHQQYSYTGLLLLTYITLALSTYFWALSSNNTLKREYEITRNNLAIVNSRESWNGILKTLTKDAFNKKISAIRSSLNALSTSGSSNQHVKRLNHSLNEISTISQTLLSDLDWYDSENHIQEQTNYSILEHVSLLTHELQTTYSTANINLFCSRDFDIELAPALLTRLITNITNNAIRHRNKDTAISIEIQKGRTLLIKNKGPRLPASLNELTIENRQGSVHGEYGLGLNVCKNICIANGILFNATSEKGLVVFQMIFPALQSNMSRELAAEKVEHA